MDPKYKMITIKNIETGNLGDLSGFQKGDNIVSIEIEPGMILWIKRTIRKNSYLGDFAETVVLTEDVYEKITGAQMRYW